VGGDFEELYCKKFKFMCKVGLGIYRYWSNITLRGLQSKHSAKLYSNMKRGLFHSVVKYDVLELWDSCRLQCKGRLHIYSLNFCNLLEKAFWKQDFLNSIRMAML
jgi:hypothetical protein